MAEERRKLTVTSKKRIYLDLEGKNYYLEEMDGMALGKFRKEMQENLVLNDSGNPVGMKKHTGTEAKLIAKCLFEEDTGTPVPENVIVNWNVSSQFELVKMCRELNRGLEEDEKKGD